jgi:predicted NodU family carbamoyl transferase
MQDEYKLMQLSQASNNTDCADILLSIVIDDIDNCTFKHNLHIGLDHDSRSRLAKYSITEIAASTQRVTEQLVNTVIRRARDLNYSTNLVYSGGVALNSIANKNLNRYFENVYVPNNPGDSGSSIGACALGYGRKIDITDYI